jgi:hypothetical protein
MRLSKELLFVHSSDELPIELECISQVAAEMSTLQPFSLRKEPV